MPTLLIWVVRTASVTYMFDLLLLAAEHNSRHMYMSVCVWF